MNNYLIIMPWLFADRLFRLCFIQHSAAISKRYTAATWYTSNMATVHIAQTERSYCHPMHKGSPKQSRKNGVRVVQQRV